MMKSRNSALLPATGALAGLTVRRNAAWSLIGNSGFMAAQLGMLVALARLGTEEIVGRYAFGLAITTPIVLLFSLQLRTLLAAHVTDDANFNVYVTIRLITMMLALGVTVLLAWFVFPEIALIVLTLGLSKSIDLLHDVIYGLYWRGDRMDFMAWSLLLRSIPGLAAFVLTFYHTGSISWAVLSLCAIWLLVFVLYDAPLATRFLPPGAPPWWQPQWSSALARRLIWLGFPAGVLSWLVSLQIYVPRYFVQHEMGEAATGIFSALASVFIGLELATRSFNHAAVPRLAKLAARRELGALRTLVWQLTAAGWVFSILLVIGSLLVGRSFITLLFGPTYAEHSAVFIILTLGFAVRSATMPTAMTLRAINAYWSLAVAQIIAILGLFAVCIVLVPRYELVGCAIACSVGFVLDSAGRSVLHHLLVMQPERTIVVRPQLREAA